MRADVLASIARQADGVYVVADDGREPLARLYATYIADLPRRQIDAFSRPVAAHRFQWFALAALILLGVDMMMRERMVSEP
jgi:hypothetical protein